MGSKYFYTVDALLWTLVLLSLSVSVSWAQKDASTSTWKEQSFATAFLMASKLTDPLCNAHQLYRQTLVVDVLHPSASNLEKWVRKKVLLMESCANAFFSLFTTLPGIELRLLAQFFQNKPFLHFTGEAEEQKITEPTISLLSWNLCCVSGGYSITDGGVLPWPYRMQQLAHAIRQQNADIVCLYEIFDIQTALNLIAEMKDLYTHFYFNIGPNVIGLSSGLFAASKFKLHNPEFVPFPQEAFDGRAKLCRKGFFSFDLLRDNQPFIKVYTTHLQHSEKPKNPTIGELRARKIEMELLLAHMKKFSDSICVLTGDLNLDECEGCASGWMEHFERGIIQGTGFTWGGDAFCSSLCGKPISSPLNLDHTLVTKNSHVHLTTTYIDTGFDGELFNPQAISDHKGLLSVITLCKGKPLQSNQDKESYGN